MAKQFELLFLNWGYPQPGLHCVTGGCVS